MNAQPQQKRYYLDRATRKTLIERWDRRRATAEALAVELNAPNVYKVFEWATSCGLPAVIPDEAESERTRKLREAGERGGAARRAQRAARLAAEADTDEEPSTDDLAAIEEGEEGEDEAISDKTIGALASLIRQGLVEEAPEPDDAQKPAPRPEPAPAPEPEPEEELAPAAEADENGDEPGYVLTPAGEAALDACAQRQPTLAAWLASGKPGAFLANGNILLVRTSRDELLSIYTSQPPLIPDMWYPNAMAEFILRLATGIPDGDIPGVVFSATARE